MSVKSLKLAVILISINLTQETIQQISIRSMFVNNHEIKERCVLLCRTIFQNLSTDMELIEHLDDLGTD